MHKRNWKTAILQSISFNPLRSCSSHVLKDLAQTSFLNTFLWVQTFFGGQYFYHICIITLKEEGMVIWPLSTQDKQNCPLINIIDHFKATGIVKLCFFFFYSSYYKLQEYRISKVLKFAHRTYFRMLKKKNLCISTRLVWYLSNGSDDFLLSLSTK